MGGSDCELLRDGWLAQPPNAWSSTAYLVAAAYLVIRRPAADTLPSVTVAGAIALALVSIGSVAYHGPQPAWADAAHDASIAALLVVVLLHAAGTGVGRLGGILLAAAVLVVVAAPWLVAAVYGALAVAVAAVELRRRRGRRGPPAVADRVAVAALGLGTTLFVLGRTGAPCAGHRRWPSRTPAGTSPPRWPPPRRSGALSPPTTPQESSLMIVSAATEPISTRSQGRCRRSPRAAGSQTARRTVRRVHPGPLAGRRSVLCPAREEQTSPGRGTCIQCPMPVSTLRSIA